jgi:hypothetical protein
MTEGDAQKAAASAPCFRPPHFSANLSHARAEPFIRLQFLKRITGFQANLH